MIEHLHQIPDQDRYGNVYGTILPSTSTIMDKINEIIDEVNQLSSGIKVDTRPINEILNEITKEEL